MKVLVTGANGFTGSHLARQLCRDGLQVRALVRPGADLALLEQAAVEVVHAEIGEDRPLDGAVAGCRVVYHVAAAYRAENIPRRVFFDVNVRGTRLLLEAALRAGVTRFVHCSTVGVQGDIKNPPAREEDPYAPGDHYQESKVEGEELALAFHREHGLPVAVVRPTGIYGPGDTRFLKLFRAIRKGRFVMIGSGKVLYHLTYIDDLVQGFILAGEKEAAVGQVFTIGGPGQPELNDLVHGIAAAVHASPPRLRVPVWPVWAAGLLCEFACKPFGIQPPLYRRRVDFFRKERGFDIGKARRLLGYQPQIALADGLRRTADWYREKGLLN